MSARYMYQKETYKKGDTFNVPADNNQWPAGLSDSIKRGNLVILGEPSPVKPTIDNSVKENVEVDLGSVTSTVIPESEKTYNPMANYPDPMTTDVTSERPVESQPKPDTSFVNDALKSAVKKTTARNTTKPKSSRAAQKEDTDE